MSTNSNSKRLIRLSDAQAGTDSEEETLALDLTQSRAAYLYAVMLIVEHDLQNQGKLHTMATSLKREARAIMEELSKERKPTIIHPNENRGNR